MNSTDKYDSEEVIAAMQTAGGSISDAAKVLRCSRTTLHKYINEKPEIREAHHDIKESNLDDAETMLNDFWRGTANGGVSEKVQSDMLKYYLSTQGKNRGFSQKKEFDHAIIGEGVAIKIAREKLKLLSPEELAEKIRELNS